MARVVKLEDARDLGLPGRVSREILSASEGAAPVTLRYVEIPVPAPDDPPRAPHSHSDTEECIHVLSGQGLFCSDDSETPLESGDTVLVPRKQLHVTLNTGDRPLVLLCFFPVAELDKHG